MNGKTTTTPAIPRGHSRGQTLKSKRKSPKLVCPWHRSRHFSQLADDCAKMARRLGFDFVSSSGPDGLILLAARHEADGAGTLAFAEPPPLDRLGQALCRYFEILGCDSAIFICPDLCSVNRLTRCLSALVPPLSTARAGFMTHRALQILLADYARQSHP